MKNIILLRGLLISAIAAGVGTVAVTQFIVRPHVKAMVAEREAHKSDWQREVDRANQLTGNLKDTQEKLAGTERTLRATEMQAAVAEEDRAGQARVAEALQKNLDTTQRDLSEARQKLAAWNAVGIPAEKVQQVVASEKQLRADAATIRDQLEAARRENRRLKESLIAIQRPYERPYETPPMPGVQGSIVAVDPKWNFVVLDVGEKAGAKPRGVFMVSREGKLIGKVKVVSVDADRSIANVMPGLQLDTIMEGDQVIF